MTESMTFRNTTWIGDDAWIDAERIVNADGSTTISAIARRCDDDNTGAEFTPWDNGTTTYSHTFAAGVINECTIEEAVGTAVMITG